MGFAILVDKMDVWCGFIDPNPNWDSTRCREIVEPGASGEKGGEGMRRMIQVTVAGETWFINPDHVTMVKQRGKWAEIRIVGSEPVLADESVQSIMTKLTSYS